MSNYRGGLGSGKGSLSLHPVVVFLLWPSHSVLGSSQSGSWPQTGDGTYSPRAQALFPQSYICFFLATYSNTLHCIGSSN